MLAGKSRARYDPGMDDKEPVAGGASCSVPPPEPCPACGGLTRDGHWVRFTLDGEKIGKVCFPCFASTPGRLAALEKRVAELEALLAPAAVVEGKDR